MMQTFIEDDLATKVMMQGMSNTLFTTETTETFTDAEGLAHVEGMSNKGISNKYLIYYS